MPRDGSLRTRFGLPGLVVAALGGCHGGSSPPPPPQAAVRYAAADPRRCLPPPGIPAGGSSMVRTCAEAFVLQQGYTPIRAKRDSALLVREPFEVGSWDLLIERRRYAVEPRALEANCDPSGCIAFFRSFRRSQGCLAVSMTRTYDALHFGRPADSELARINGTQRCL